jgi:hypothetical protein
MEFRGLDCATAEDGVHTGAKSKASTAIDERWMMWIMTRPPLEIEIGGPAFA